MGLRFAVSGATCCSRRHTRHEAIRNGQEGPETSSTSRDSASLSANEPPVSGSVSIEIFLCFVICVFNRSAVVPLLYAGLIQWHGRPHPAHLQSAPVKPVDQRSEVLEKAGGQGFAGTPDTSAAVQRTRPYG